MDRTQLALERMTASLDRFQEAHFWIHFLERNYHYADPFRWYLNVFLKALKEVPQVLPMELHGQTGFTAWFRDQKRKLRSDPLLSALARRRDYVVHQGMLVPRSHGAIGLTDGRGFKHGLTLPIHQLEDSDTAMRRYLTVAVRNGKDILDLFIPDDCTLPCVYREWKIEPFDEEIVELAARAWLRVGETVTEVARWLGADVPALSLNCRHTAQDVQFKTYDRSALSKEFEAIRRGSTANGV